MFRLMGIVSGLDARFEKVRKISCISDARSGGYICNYRLRINASYDDETAAFMTSWGGTRAQAEMPLKLITGLSNMLDATEVSRTRFVLTRSGWSARSLKPGGSNKIDGINVNDLSNLLGR